MHLVGFTIEITVRVQHLKTERIKEVFFFLHVVPSFQNSISEDEISSILETMKIHYRVHKSRLLVPVLRQMNPVYTFPS